MHVDKLIKVLQVHENQLWVPVNVTTNTAAFPVT